MSTLAAATEVLEDIGVRVLERGWLSANNVLIRGEGPSAMVDSGYASHADQTQALVQHELNGQCLDVLLNTHLHSDHCGGNAGLQALYPALQTLIPPGSAEAVARWDTQALTYASTGQLCPRFLYTGLLSPGEQHRLGSRTWEVHGAKGHDPHSIILFQPESRVLISADALWENGFGVVFPELEGIKAFQEVSETLDLIERLEPQIVIPGHGRVFQDAKSAMARARTRLDQFVSSPEKHQRYASKVLIKFRLMEWQRISRNDLQAWVLQTPYLRAALGSNEPSDQDAWVDCILDELKISGALRQEGEQIINI